MRCFIALPLPEPAREALAGIAAAYREDYAKGVSMASPSIGRAPKITWARVEGFHLTLAFLGELAGEREARALEVASAAVRAASDFEAIGFSIAGLGSFPERGRWRVLFARLGDGGRASILHRLVNEALADGAKRSGLPPLNKEWPGGKPFVPHVTFARRAPGAAAPLPAPGGLLGAAAGAWTLGRCSLYKSELRRSGAVYTELLGVDLPGKSRPLES